MALKARSIQLSESDSGDLQQAVLHRPADKRNFGTPDPITSKLPTDCNQRAASSATIVHSEFVGKMISRIANGVLPFPSARKYLYEKHRSAEQSTWVTLNAVLAQTGACLRDIAVIATHSC